MILDGPSLFPIGQPGDDDSHFVQSLIQVFQRFSKPSNLVQTLQICDGTTQDLEMPLSICIVNVTYIYVRANTVEIRLKFGKLTDDFRHLLMELLKFKKALFPHVESVLDFVNCRAVCKFTIWLFACLSEEDVVFSDLSHQRKHLTDFFCTQCVVGRNLMFAYQLQPGSMKLFKLFKGVLKKHLRCVNNVKKNLKHPILFCYL